MGPLVALLALLSTVDAVGAVQTNVPDTVRFTPTGGHRTFAVREPVLSIQPGTVLITNTLFGTFFSEGGGSFPPDVGPIYVQGATPEDLLAVEILQLRPNHSLAASQTYADAYNGLATDRWLRLLNDPIESRRYEWRLDLDANTATTLLPDSRMREITIELRPMLGRLGVAPRGEEAFSTVWPGDFGGNFDAPEVREGTTVYLPIFHEGAYLYFGDAHARQGEGELSGTALETSVDVTFKIDVLKGRTIDWPRFEDDDYIMVAGSGRPLIDALRIAHVELVEWLEEEYGFSRPDAYQLVGQLSETTVASIVNPAHTVVAKFPKKYLPQ